jgi:hypothetical protein
MGGSFRLLIDRSKSILILLPKDLYFDYVAAGLSVFLALKDQKDVSIYSPTPMIVEFNRLVGVDKVSTDLGNKNLVINFLDYDAANVERVVYDVDGNNSKLVVIPKQTVPPPAREQIQLSYSGTSADTVIIIGGSDASNFPALLEKDLASAEIAHIGIRDITLPMDKKYISFSKPASSVSEVVFGLLKESELEINEDIATNLIMGIENATDNLLSETVTADTFSAVADLMKLGGKRSVPRPRLGQFVRPISNTVIASADSGDKGMGVNRHLPPEDKSADDRKSVYQSTAGSVKTIDLGDVHENPPPDWLKPKVFKGTSTDF